MEHFKKLCFRSDKDTHREQFRCISLYMFIVNVGLYKEPEFAPIKIHQKLKKHAFYLENTTIVQSVCTEVLFVLDSKKSQVEKVFPIEISVFSTAAVIRYR